MDRETVDTIAAQLQRELDTIKSLQSTAEQRLRDEVKRKEAETHEIFEQLLRAQARQAQEQEDRRREAEARRKFWLKFVLGPSGALAAIIGGGVAWVQSQKPPAPTAQEQVEKVEQVEQAVTNTVESRVGDVEARLDKNDEKIKRTVDILLEQQVQLSESTDYIIDKIEKAHPNTRSVDEPPAVTESRDRAEAIRRRKRVDFDPADPLAGLE